MEVRGDASGIDEFEKDIEDAYFAKMVEIGRDAVVYAKKNGTYRNHTWNLRNAPGFCIVRDGKVVTVEVGDDGGHPEAAENTRDLLLYSEHPRDGLYLADGMFYASFVESKGYDVLRGSIFYAQKQVRKKIFK